VKPSSWKLVDKFLVVKEIKRNKELREDFFLEGFELVTNNGEMKRVQKNEGQFNVQSCGVAPCLKKRN